jgi:protein-S-isoprenylcysteine O-methyltransferase Ste14
VHLLGEAVLGVLMICLLALLVVVKRVATGSVLDERPDARPPVRVVNAFNLGFLLVVNPAAAALLLAERLHAWDISRVEVPWPWLRTAVEAVGVGTYVAGCALMMWALLSLKASYQLGGMAPRSRDALVTRGPYGFVRHPMYTAALAMALGLALALQSLLCLAIFGGYLVMLNALMPLEEAGLRGAYGEAYDAYSGAVPRLIPFRLRA